LFLFVSFFLFLFLPLSFSHVSCLPSVKTENPSSGTILTICQRRLEFARARARVIVGRYTLNYRQLASATLLAFERSSGRRAENCKLLLSSCVTTYLSYPYSFQRTVCLVCVYTRTYVRACAPPPRPLYNTSFFPSSSFRALFLGLSRFVRRANL